MNLKMLLLPTLILGSLAVQGKVEVASVFGNNMVLQQGRKVPVWGKALPNEKITVRFDGQTVSTTTAKNGKWMLYLAPMKANAAGQTLEVLGKTEKVKFNNILIGEVWLCSGQSNMHVPMWSKTPNYRAANGDKDVKAGVNPMIRIVSLEKRGIAKLPIEQQHIVWNPLNEKTGLPFSAVAFYFGQALYKQLKVPIGLVASNWPGTRIEPWTPQEGFNSVPELKQLAFEGNAKIPGTKEYKEQNAKAIQLYENWLKEYKKAVAAGKLPPLPPEYPAELRYLRGNLQPSSIYNKMIHPLVPFAFRGVIWYQGCSNIYNGYDGPMYAYKMQALLNGWREVFKQPDMPFYFVQLAPFRYGKKDPYKLPVIWEAQHSFAQKNRDTQVKMAVINDVGDYDDIHPRDKKTVGNRLALLALRYTYNKKEIKADSPELKKWQIKGNQVILDFDFVEKWIAKGEVKHFEVAGKDQIWQQATMKVQGKTLLISSEKVNAPVMLRYMWHHTVTGNLFNEAGLPLGTFRCGTIPVK